MRKRKGDSLHTERLTLRPVGARYLDDLWDAIESSAGEIGEWMSWGVDPTKDQTRAFVESSERAWDMGLEWNWVLALSGRAIGGIGIGQHVPLVRSAQLGYWLRTDVAGRGLMTEAGEAVVRYGFSTLELHRLELHAAPENKASVRVAEKLGFQHEGCLRDGSYARRGWHDVHVFGLLTTDPGPRA